MSKRLLALVERGKRHAEIVVIPRLVRLQPHCLPAMRQGFVKTAEFGESFGQPIMCPRISGTFRHGIAPDSEVASIVLISLIRQHAQRNRGGRSSENAPRPNQRCTRNHGEGNDRHEWQIHPMLHHHLDGAWRE